MAEIHGCGEEAKKAARAAWLKSHEQKDSKPMTEEKRKILQHQLQKKITKQVESRSAKRPGGKK
jgi:hypothetical protein